MKRPEPCLEEPAMEKPYALELEPRTPRNVGWIEAAWKNAGAFTPPWHRLVGCHLETAMWTLVWRD